MFYQYSEFNQYSQLTLEEETLSDLDCGKEDAECITMQNYQWVPFVSLFDFSTNPTADLSTYVTPQFYKYQYTQAGEPIYKFYDAIPCN